MNATTTNSSAATAASTEGDAPQDGPSPSTDGASTSDADIPPEPEDVPDPSAVALSVACERLRQIDVAWLQSHAERAIEATGVPVERISIAILDDGQMAALHKQHCNENTTTDVLTFPLNEPGDAVDAEIAVCADVAARRADEFSHSIERELLLYIVHGLLHCCGYDDRDNESYRAMHRREDEILESIGVGATFARGRSRSGAEIAEEGTEEC